MRKKFVAGLLVSSLLVSAFGTTAAAGDQAMFNYPTSNLIMTNPYDYPITLQVIYDGLT